MNLNSDLFWVVFSYDKYREVSKYCCTVVTYQHVAMHVHVVV